MTKKKKVIGVAGLGAVALIGGTFAYFSQQTTIDNPFDTAKYGTIVTEDFNPEDGEDWEPGVEVNKDLYVDNTGDRDVVVRVRFEDFWYRDTIENPFVHLENRPVWKPDEGTGRQPDSTDAEGNSISGTIDGIVEKDRTVVDKNFANLDDWYFNDSDGYFYYKKNLAKGASTGLFLDSVILNKDTDMGKINTQYYFTIAKTGEKPSFEKGDTIATWSDANKENWIAIGSLQGKDDATWTVHSIDELLKETNNNAAIAGYIAKCVTEGTVTEKDGSYELVKGYSLYTSALTEPTDVEHLGYSDAKYTLRITVETVQATDEAVKNVFHLETLPTELGWDLDPESLEATTATSAEETTSSEAQGN